MIITSEQNNKVKKWKKLLRRKGREKENAFLVEGNHLVEEALNSSWTVDEIIICEGTETNLNVGEIDKTIVAKAIFEMLTETESPQGVIAVVRMRPQQLNPSSKKLLLVDAVQDPGNVGTLVRTADAAGYDGIILGKGTADLFNDKVIRSSQGSIFHIPVIQSELTPWITDLKGDNFSILATALRGAKPYKELTIDTPLALIVGNEGAGVSPDVLASADERVYIPIYGHAESLNVGIAAGILMYYFQD